MKIVALLSWYDERPSWLAATISSLAGFADHIVAVDGAYSLYPNGRRSSPIDQQEAVYLAADTNNMGCTIYTPPTAWDGNEVEKRSHMFALAETLTTEDDWYFPIDADEVCTFISPIAKEMLTETEFDAADITLWARGQLPDRDDMHEKARAFRWDNESSAPQRQLFRALRGMKVESNHYHYFAQGKQLWGDAPVEGLNMTEHLTVEHRNTMRTVARDEDRLRYYARRDEMQAECKPS